MCFIGPRDIIRASERTLSHTGNCGKERTYDIHGRMRDGLWLAEVLELPGVLAYGETAWQAVSKAQARALRVLAERIEHGEISPETLSIRFAAA